MVFQPVIGLEVHAELKTKSKVFCPCPVVWKAPPNTVTCPICMGFPGVLPVLNRKALELTLRTAIALNCHIHHQTIFERKNYYYPDLPKGYQISQKRIPIGFQGWLEIATASGRKKIRIHDVHLEEDTGKSVHGEEAGDPSASFIDYNRSGVPLCEIISEPDIHSVEELEQFMIKLRQLLLFLDVSECRMERGHLRFEASVSVRPQGTNTLGTRVEIKNLNSFRAVSGAVQAEIERQIALLKEGRSVQQQTMLWNEASKRTEPMRTKETAHDYRYFPEPDLVPVLISDEWLAQIRQTLPETADEKTLRFVRVYGLSEKEAELLTATPAVAHFFESAVRHFHDPKGIGNWMLGDLQGLLNESQKDWETCPVSPESLAQLVQLIDDQTISVRMAKEVLREMFATGRAPKTIVSEKGLVQIADQDYVRKVVIQVINNHPHAVADYLSGKDKLIGFFVGQVMKATGGKANPQLANRLVREALESRRTSS
ncbi:MAG: Asp-tRNA(Asn)/Glu-tRNA(Gln) amidotransferase subunit GatB [Armatimonadetes bacterium]|nr:Asp-tRNA(Asn)/Glu-tRNA(Gln) amidotransferase subunit GatB [Armatimonadota bacterium]MDW8122556.1 Asp-tRNA(Asn)/Glu-tRNA(Gln) amidotransferase subunit GatB [Armatimonadota bacterium]